MFQMRKLKRTTISKCEEQSSDNADGESLSKKAEIGNKKISNKVHPSSKLCQLCKKRLWISFHGGKWCCRSCRARALKQKTEYKKEGKSDLEKTSSSASLQNVIQSGALKSMFTIQIQNDGKRSVKANQDCKEPSNEKQLSFKEINTEKTEMSCSTVIECNEVENSKEIVVNKNTLNSPTKYKTDNNIYIQTKENSSTKPFNSILSPEKMTVKPKIYEAQMKIHHKERTNKNNKSLFENKSSHINSPSTNKVLEKSSNGFPSEPDSSLFGCVETCFDHLEEVDMKLFLEYVHILKKSNIVCIDSNVNATDTCSVIGNALNFDHSKPEKDQDTTSYLGGEHKTSSSNLETSKTLSTLNIPNNDKKDMNNKETAIMAEETTSLVEKKNEKQLSVKHKRTLNIDKEQEQRRSSKSSNEKKKSQIFEITSEKNLSSTNAVKCKSPCSKQNNDKSIISANFLSENLSFSIRNESHFNKETKLSLQNKYTKSPKKKFAVDSADNDVHLTKNINKIDLSKDQLPATKKNVTDNYTDCTLLSEKEVLSNNNIVQHNTPTPKDAAAELNLVCTENETQHSNGKSSVSNDLYSQEAETLDYEPEDEVIPSIETLNFTEELEISDFEKADFDKILQSSDDKSKSHLFDTSTQIVYNDSNKKKNSVWEIDSDDGNLESEILPTSSPELLCTVDEDEENYIDEKSYASHLSSNKLEVQSHISTSTSMSDASTVKETLQVGKDNASSKNKCRNVPELISSESKLCQKQVPANNAIVAFKNENYVQYDFSKLRGYCYQFLKKGTCPKRLCRFRHIKPLPDNFKDNIVKIHEHPQHNQCSEQNYHSEYNFMKENTKSGIGANEDKNLVSRMERASNHIITDRSTDQYAKQFDVCNNDRHETNLIREDLQNINNYQVLQQRNNILQLVCENEWSTLSLLFHHHFHDGVFVKHLKNAFWHQQVDVGNKFQQFVHFMTSKQELEKEKVYILGQIGCSIILEAQSAGKFEIAFEVLKILHQHDINYYYLQHNINQSLGFPLWGIITPSWIALVAVDTCVHLEKIAEAIQILEGCQWAMPSSELSPEVKKKEVVMRINIFQQLIEIAAKKNMTNFVIKILKMILDIFSEDFADTEMRNSMSDNIKQLYKYYISTLIDHQDIESAMSLYMYFWKLKPALNLSSEIHRAIIVLAIRNNKELRARNLFQTCTNMGIYKIGEPSLSSLPHCLRVQTCWTSEEMQLALNHYLEQLLNNLVKREKNFNDVCSQELFSLHIVFKESSLIQNAEYLFHFLSPVRLHESRERMITAINKLIFPLDFEQKTERTIHIKPNSLHNYFILWKMENGDGKDLEPASEKDTSFTSSLKTLATNYSSPTKNTNFSRYTDTADAAENINDEWKKSNIDSLHNKTFSSYATNSSSLSSYSFQDYNVMYSYDFDQTVNHSPQKGLTRILLQETKNHLNNDHSSLSLFNKDKHLSKVGRDSESNKSYTETGFAQKSMTNNETTQHSMSHLQVPPINITFSSVPHSRLKPPPSSNRSFCTSSFQPISASKKLQFNSTMHRKPVYTKKAFIPQTQHKLNSNLIVKNKTALAKKYLNTPRKPNERIIKPKSRQVPSAEENVKSLSVQKSNINSNSCDSSKVFNYIKSQLLCHHKGNSSVKDLNRQAQELTNKFISENEGGISTNSTLLDRKRMKTLVDFTKLHINERMYQA